MLSILTILDDFKLNQDLNPASTLRLDLLVRLIVGMMLKSSKDPKGSLVLEYAFKVLNKYISMPSVNIQAIIENCQDSLLKMLLMTILLNDKPI